MHFRMDFQKASYNYLGKQWASNINSVAMLLYLAAPFELISPFFAETNETALATDTIIPTLSPKDQKFAPWWEIHKSEWEQSMKTGFKRNTPYTLGTYQSKYFSATLQSNKKWNDDDDIIMI